MQLPIYGGYYNSESLPVSAQRLVNAHVQIPQTEGALSQKIIKQTSGLTQQDISGLLAADSNRGAWEMAGIPYFVNGTSLVRINKTGLTFALETLGTVTGTGEVSMSDNGTQLIIVSNGSGWIYNHVTPLFSAITDPHFTSNGNPQKVVFVDAYFVLNTDDKKFIISALNDGLAYNPLDFEAAVANPDDIVAPGILNNRLYIFGSKTTEPFRNTGNVDFPFQTIQGALLNKGCHAPNSILNGSNHLYWVGGGQDERSAIWRSGGQAPEKISTTAIDDLIQSQDSSLISAWTYAESGSKFLGFNLVNTTIVYDEINNVWHERQSRYQDTLNVTQTIGWRVTHLATAYDKVWVGDSLDGRIGTIERDISTEYEESVLRTLITAPFETGMDTFFLPQLELTMQSGTGNAAVNDPIMRLSISRDNGNSFGPERQRVIGKVGEYNHRIIWLRNGRFTKSAVLKFEWSECATYVIIRADAKIKQGINRFAA